MSEQAILNTMWGKSETQFPSEVYGIHFIHFQRNSFWNETLKILWKVGKWRGDIIRFRFAFRGIYFPIFGLTYIDLVRWSLLKGVRVGGRGEGREGSSNLAVEGILHICRSEICSFIVCQLNLRMRLTISRIFRLGQWSRKSHILPDTLKECFIMNCIQL